MVRESIPPALKMYILYRLLYRSVGFVISIRIRNCQIKLFLNRSKFLNDKNFARYKVCRKAYKKEKFTTEKNNNTICNFYNEIVD